MTPEAQLLTQYSQNRSEAAFTEFVQGRINLVYSVALRCVGGDPHRAAEVSQDVFIATASHASRLAHHPVLSAWLHAATRNSAANLLRAERRRTSTYRRASEMGETDCTCHSPDWESIRPVLDEVLSELSDRDRHAVILRFFDNCSYSELGTRLSIREDTARMRVARALEKLRSRLHQLGIKSTAVTLSSALTGRAVGAIPLGLATDVAHTALATVRSGMGSTAILPKLIYSMSTAKAAGVVASVIAIIAINSALYEYHAARKSAVALQSATQEIERLRAETVGLTAGTPDQRSTPPPAGVGPSSQHSVSTADSKPPMQDRQGAIRANLNRGVIKAEALADLGQKTPRDALESFHWAQRYGDNAALAKLITIAGPAKDDAAAIFAGLPSATQAAYGSPEQMVAVFAAKDGLSLPTAGDIQIISETTRRDGTISIATEFDQGNPGDQSNRSTFELQSGTAGWQVVVPSTVIQAIRTQLEISP